MDIILLHNHTNDYALFSEILMYILQYKKVSIQKYCLKYRKYHLKVLFPRTFSLMDQGTVVHFEMRLFPVDAQPFAGIVGNTCNILLEQTLLRVPW